MNHLNRALLISWSWDCHIHFLWKPVLGFCYCPSFFSLSCWNANNADGVIPYFLTTSLLCNSLGISEIMAFFTSKENCFHFTQAILIPNKERNKLQWILVKIEKFKNKHKHSNIPLTVMFTCCLSDAHFEKYGEWKKMNLGTEVDKRKSLKGRKTCWNDICSQNNNVTFYLLNSIQRIFHFCYGIERKLSLMKSFHCNGIPNKMYFVKLKFLMHWD